jgi:hypothetical protein
VDGIYKNASFCKYLCPIGQFQFLSSLMSPLEVRVREADVCASCKTHDCIRGNGSQRGCELLLFLPKKSGNLDCTFCLDCEKACPHDNVGILASPRGRDLIEDPQRSSAGQFARRPDLAALALVFVFGAFANAAGMVAPVREWEDSLRMAAGPRVETFVWIAVFTLFVGILPLVLARICGTLSGLAANENSTLLTWGFSAALIPLGFSMWAAHFAFHLFTGALAPWPILQRIARDLGLGTRMPGWNVPTLAFEGLTGLQILFLNAGLLISLWIFWRKSCARDRRPLAIFLPWATLAAALYATGIWLLFQPMDMRGVMP